MKRFAALCTATVLASTLIACNQTSGNTEADIAAIKAVEAQWNRGLGSPRHRQDYVPLRR